MKRPLTEPPCLLIIFLIFLAPHAFSECYFPNGSLETNPAYQPCPGFDGTASMCCATNRTNPFGGADTNGWTANKCLPNGLCLDGFTTIDQHGKTVMVQQYWRDLCTSRNWDDGGCLKACAQYANNKTIRMTPCGDPNTSTTWCCGDNMDCCNSSSAEYVPATLQGYILTSTTTSSASESTSTTASTSGATPTTENASPTSASLERAVPSFQGLSTAAKTGIGVGVGTGAVVLLVGLAWILARKRRPRGALEEESRPSNAAFQSPRELAGSEVVKEMPSNSTTLIQELPGHS